MRYMYDSTGLPPNPPNVDCVAFYIGGEDPYRVWPRAEIDRIKTRFRLPIWVSSKPPNAAATGHSEGLAAARICADLGQPKGTCIALDLETAQDPQYASAFDAGVQSAGYLCMGYGSASTLSKNGKFSGGYWLAEWDGVNSLPNGVAAKQYANSAMTGQNWDLSVVSDSARLWDSERKNTVSSASDVWEYPIGVPGYAAADHPGVSSIPAGGWLRGAEHQIHGARADIAALAKKIDDLTASVNALVAELHTPVGMTPPAPAPANVTAPTPLQSASSNGA